MEDEEGYMAIDLAQRDAYMQPTSQKMQDSTTKCQCWKITLGASLTLSIVLNATLITLLILFQVRDSQDCSCQGNPPNSCGWASGSSTAYVTLNPATAHRRLVLSTDLKTVTWGKEEMSLPNNTERFDQRVWVLGREGFLSGKHCWEVEVKGDGEWAVGVAKESLKRKGLPDFSPAEGIWAIGEYWGVGNYRAFTSPQPTQLFFDKKPRRIRVSLDYTQRQVEFFNPETKKSIYTFSSAAFSGEKIYPWFRVWDGTELTLHP
ncbi:PREDICTED: tripartite motif-containing protein 7-like isoform X1 [Gekko japonicus]|uniref:Tripartite motif-containing protein 7-like isoform X1 n=1 Tax=Gekko japonicus TaxID=146911 RepID=A0ABM1KA06_GEKJA|nr:PREDICTED: tripartite motif-containing protein 7-like isoform X1 [Gekko japonicus]